MFSVKFSFAQLLFCCILLHPGTLAFPVHSGFCCVLCTVSFLVLWSTKLSVAHLVPHCLVPSFTTFQPQLSTVTCKFTVCCLLLQSQVVPYTLLCWVQASCALFCPVLCQVLSFSVAVPLCSLVLCPLLCHSVLCPSVVYKVLSCTVLHHFYCTVACAVWY